MFAFAWCLFTYYARSDLNLFVVAVVVILIVSLPVPTDTINMLPVVTSTCSPNVGTPLSYFKR